MVATTKLQQGRVLRIGLGWADVAITGRTVRVRVPPGRIVHVGSIVRIASRQILDIAPTQTGA